MRWLCSGEWNLATLIFKSKKNCFYLIKNLFSSFVLSTFDQCQGSLTITLIVQRVEDVD